MMPPNNMRYSADVVGATWAQRTKMLVVLISAAPAVIWMSARRGAGRSLDEARGRGARCGHGVNPLMLGRQFLSLGIGDPLAQSRQRKNGFNIIAFDRPPAQTS